MTFDHFEEICLASDYHKTRGRLPDDFHLDRIDVHQGYVDGNVQVITASANCKKRHEEYKGTYLNDEPDPF